MRFPLPPADGGTGDGAATPRRLSRASLDRPIRRYREPRGRGLDPSAWPSWTDRYCWSTSASNPLDWNPWTDQVRFTTREGGGK